MNSARVSARYLADRAKPWDLMAWRFSAQGPATASPAEDRGAIGARGRRGARARRRFPGLLPQKRDGSIYDGQMQVMAEVARFCRERQALCHHAEAVPQVALLFRPPRHYRRSTDFSRATSSECAACCRLCWDSANRRDRERASSDRAHGALAAHRRARVGLPRTGVPRGAARLRQRRRQFAAGRAAPTRCSPSDLGVTLKGEPKVETRHLAHRDVDEVERAGAGP